MESHEFFLRHSQEWSLRYAGKYIGVVNNKIAAIGESELEVFRKVKERYPKGTISIAYLPTDEEMVTLLVMIR